MNSGTVRIAFVVTFLLGRAFTSNATSIVDPEYLFDISKCGEYLSSKASSTAKERDQAAELVEWVYLTHPVYERAMTRAKTFEEQLTLMHLPLGYAVAPWRGPWFIKSKVRTQFEKNLKFVSNSRQNFKRLDLERRKLMMSSSATPEETLHLTSVILLRSMFILRELSKVGGGTDLFPPLDFEIPCPSQADQSIGIVSVKIERSFEKTDFDRLTALLDFLQSETVRMLFFKDVHRKLEDIVRFHGYLCDFADNNSSRDRLGALFHKDVEPKFAASVAPPVSYARWINVQPGIQGQPSEPEPEVPTEFTVFDSSSLDQFLSAEPPPPSASEADGIGRAYHDLQRASGLINETLAQLQIFGAAPTDWSPWRDATEDQTKLESIDEFSKSGTARTYHELKQLSAGAAALDRLRDWHEHRRAALGILSKAEGVGDLSAHDHLVLAATLDFSNRLSAALSSAIDSVDQRRIATLRQSAEFDETQRLMGLRRQFLVRSEGPPR